MAVEIERKFLVVGRPWEGQAGRPLNQGYLKGGDGTTVRVRSDGRTARITIKGRSSGIARPEFEYPVPLDEAEALLALCEDGRVRKTRYALVVGEHTWDLDVFEGENAPLVLAEVELSSEDEAFVRPDWLGAEVSGDARYFNAFLARHPYSGWADR